MTFTNLNIWDTDFRVSISNKMINKVKQQIIKKGNPTKLYKSTSITPIVYYRLLNGKGTAIKNYQQIINFLNINKREAEKEIIGLTYNGGKFTYPHIKKFNPLLFRIICHIIGDGNISCNNTCRWIQHKSNSHWLSELIKKEIGFLPTITKKENCNAITISAYFSKLLQYMMNIDIKLIKDPKTIKTFLRLSKEYRLQFLAAFIVDEGHIRYKKARSCIISQSNKEFLKVVSSILNSLNYQHSEIKEEISKKGFVVYRLNIYSTGMLQFYKDINNLVKKYGIYAGLWHKQNSLNQYIKTLNKNIKYTKLEKDSINYIINDLLEQNKTISYKDLKTHPILSQKLKIRSKRYLISKFYGLVRSGHLVRLSDGVYTKPTNI